MINFSDKAVSDVDAIEHLETGLIGYQPWPGLYADATVNRKWTMILLELLHRVLRLRPEVSVNAEWIPRSFQQSLNDSSDGKNIARLGDRITHDENPD